MSESNHNANNGTRAENNFSSKDDSADLNSDLNQEQSRHHNSNQNSMDKNQNDLLKQIADLESLVEKYKTDFLYLRADFDNYKKHSIKERADYLKYGSERLVIEMLNVYDNFERALEAKTTLDNFSNFVKGIQLTSAEFKSALVKSGVSEVASIGQQFDPMIHEALGAEDSSEYPAGYVSKVLKKPYKLHDKLIRPGQVLVAKS